MAISRARAIKEIRALGFHAFHHDGESDIVKVSAEEGDGAANYYAPGDCSPEQLDAAGLDYAGINQKLAQWAERNELYFDWENPGCLVAYRA